MMHASTNLSSSERLRSSRDPVVNPSPTAHTEAVVVRFARIRPIVVPEHRSCSRLFVIQRDAVHPTVLQIRIYTPHATAPTISAMKTRTQFAQVLQNGAMVWLMVRIHKQELLKRLIGWC